MLTMFEMGNYRGIRRKYPNIKIWAVYAAIKSMRHSQNSEKWDLRTIAICAERLESYGREVAMNWKGYVFCSPNNFEHIT